MVDLTRDRPGDHLFVRAVTDEAIQVVDTWYSGSIVIGAERIVRDWAPNRVDELDADHLDSVLALNPEVVIIGTGARQQLLSPELMVRLLGHGIGAEVMSTPAACRTFNVLVSEGRQVVAALWPPGA